MTFSVKSSKVLSQLNYLFPKLNQSNMILSLNVSITFFRPTFKHTNGHAYTEAYKVTHIKLHFFQQPLRALNEALNDALNKGKVGVQMMGHLFSVQPRDSFFAKGLEHIVSAIIASSTYRVNSWIWGWSISGGERFTDQLPLVEKVKYTQALAIQLLNMVPRSYKSFVFHWVSRNSKH